MFNLFKKKSPVVGDELTITIADMHCASCALSIDDALEELEGVSSSSTNYAKSSTRVSFDKEKVDYTTIKKTIEKLGYSVIE